MNELWGGVVGNKTNEFVVNALAYTLSPEILKGKFSSRGKTKLPVLTLPNKAYLSKINIICVMLEKNPIYPKFSINAIKNVVRLSLPLADKKTIQRYVDILMTLSEKSPKIYELEIYDMSNLVDTMKEISDKTSGIDKEYLWKTKLGYKFGLFDDSVLDRFESGSKTTEIHCRLPELLKNSYEEFVRKKHNGRIQSVLSVEVNNSLSDYIMYVKKEIEYSKRPRTTKQ